ncbi:uncharacterized protein LOC125889189 [Xyrichtys novacula]|uniref:Uncharacterized protein LOC125889189 n=1 Tax=Xyrichtys novacula TaxID=13765 RepID=A0AAV1GTE5_XYRNO|nr:uncharacterized protein LOC125889189 [Xyrichtys novacula]
MRETRTDKQNQDLVTYDSEVEPWVPLSGQQSLSGAENSNLNENSSHSDSDNGFEDAHDNSHIKVTDDSEPEPWTPLSGQQSASGGAEVCVSFNCLHVFHLLANIASALFMSLIVMFPLH